ncbi:hypothetical protein BFP76_05795 [Amylibacter kogurei]|uniref:Pilus assembly protein TadE n=1 Tax=Paramylibacter kogurei TaxID=1889778 RepID=A0A2G5K5L8_9RHOB|nr:hypothetical protein [Amylibacter kogurei]PIB24695.1 hypothetical protein BFP76_05795 [Amylibacter kogurei]
MSLLKLKRFGRSESGTMTVEAVLMFPIMYWLIIFGPVLFDIVREKTSVVRNSFTIADIISREENVTEETMEFYESMFASLMPQSSRTGLRVTSIVRDEVNPDDYDVRWSHGNISDRPEIASRLDEMDELIPFIEPGESILYVEGFQTYSSVISYSFAGWNLGWRDKELGHNLFIRPRYFAEVNYVPKTPPEEEGEESTEDP